MTKFRNSDRNDQSALIDDAQLDDRGGRRDGLEACRQAACGPAVGGWTMQDIWTRPTLGTYH